MMNEEELRKEATSTIEWESTPMIDRPLFIHAYITSAKPREKCIEEQKVTIEKLKKENELFKKANEIIAQQRDDRDADISILENQIEELEEQLTGQRSKESQLEKMKSLLKEIYEEYGFSELVKIRNDLPTEIQEIIKDINEK